MRASSAFIKLFIRGIAADALKSGVSFSDALETVALAKRDDVLKGKVLIGTASQGTQVQFALPPVGDLSAEDLAEVCSKLLDQVDALKAATPGLTDVQLKTALLLANEPRTWCVTDHSNGRL